MAGRFPVLTEGGDGGEGDVEDAADVGGEGGADICFGLDPCGHAGIGKNKVERINGIGRLNPCAGGGLVGHIDDGSMDCEVLRDRVRKGFRIPS